MKKLLLLVLVSTSLHGAPCLQKDMRLPALLALALDDPQTLLQQSPHETPLCLLAVGLGEMKAHDLHALAHLDAYEKSIPRARGQGLLDEAAVLEALLLARRHLEGTLQNGSGIKELLGSLSARSLEAQVLAATLLYAFQEPTERARTLLHLQQIADDTRTPLLLRGLVLEDLTHNMDYRKHPERSIEALDRLIRLIKPLHARYFKGMAAYNLAIMHIYRDTPEGNQKAEQSLLQARGFLQGMPPSRLHGATRISQANLLSRRGHWAAAVRLLQESFPYFSAAYDREWRGEAYIKLATISLGAQKWQNALDAVVKARQEMPESMIYDHNLLYDLEAQAQFGLHAWSKAYAALDTFNKRSLEFDKSFAKDIYEVEAARLGLQAEEEKTRINRLEKDLASENLRIEAMKTRALRLQLGQRLGLAVLLITLTLIGVWIGYKVFRSLFELRRMNHYLATQVLQRFMPPQAIQSVLQGTLQLHEQPEQRLVTALSVDIVSFTQAAETLGTAEISRILNRFMVATTQTIFAHNGLIERYVGDAVMVIFGDTGVTPASEQARQAVACAEALLSCLKEVNQDVPEDQAWRLTVRIGIHQGLAIVGSIGREARKDYMALGEAVSTAQKLQEEADPGEILISRPLTYHLPEQRFKPRSSHRSLPATVELFKLVA